MVRVILVKRAESGKYWRVGLPLAPGTSPGAARAANDPLASVLRAASPRFLSAGALEARPMTDKYPQEKTKTRHRAI